MLIAISIIAFIYPFYNFGFFVTDRFISFPDLGAVLVDLYFIFLLIRKDIKLKAADFNWSLAYFIFVVFLILGMLISPYRYLVFQKGSIQIISIVVMLVFCIFFVSISRIKSAFIIRFIKVLNIGLGCYALIAILQFIFWDLLGATQVLNFEGFCKCWRWGGMEPLNEFHRVRSLASEPTHYALILGIGIGSALLRLGILGRRVSYKIKNIMPLWAALSIIISLCLTLSINAYLLLILIGLSFLSILTAKINLKIVLSIFSICCMLVFAIISNMDSIFSKKVGSIKYILYPELLIKESDFDIRSGLSALTMIVNYKVAKNNLNNNYLFGGGVGSHPKAYEKYVSKTEYMRSDIWYGLNKDDAASLSLRLLSETGLIGLGLFLFASGLIIFRSINFLKKSTLITEKNILALSMVCSFIGIQIMYLIRVGHYYDLSYWLLVALVVSTVNMSQQEISFVEKH